MKNLIIGVVVVAVLALGTFLLIQNNSKSDTKKSTESSNTSSTSETQAASDLTIIYTDNGFSPETATVKSGGKIIWKNSSSSSELQVGVNPHPSHTGDREITGGDFVVTVSPGESKSITVEKKGTFGYHNHLSAGDSGSVTVE